jgi:hypothetical protein
MNANVELPAGVAAEESRYGSDLVADALHALGVRYLPMNPGSSFRGLHDSVVNHGGNREPQLLLCLHEEIAVSLAHGYAKATGGIGVAALHDLVGLMHASMAVYDAFCDRTPMLLLGGSGPADPAQRRPIDWVHSATTQAQLVRDYVVWDAEPATAAAAVTDIVRAYQRALSAPRGPAYVSLDAGMQEAVLEAPAEPPDLDAHAPAPRVAPDPVALARAAALLADAEYPVVIAGRVGLDPQATEPVRELVELLGAAYRDDRNCVVLPTDHPQNLGGDPEILRHADVVLAIDVVDLPGLLAQGGQRGRRDAPATAPVNRPDVVDLSHGDLGLRSWSNAFAEPVPRTVALLTDPLLGVRQLIDELRRVIIREPRHAGAPTSPSGTTGCARNRRGRSRRDGTTARSRPPGWSPRRGPPSATSITCCACVTPGPGRRGYGFSPAPARTSGTPAAAASASVTGRVRWLVGPWLPETTAGSGWGSSVMATC